jgi:predicted nucleotidyltransferase
VDFSHPFRVIAPTLDGPVLRALAGSRTALTRPQVLRVVGEGSEAGVRKVLRRLVEQGIVVEEHVGSRYTYRANREHIMWPAIEVLTSAHEILDERIQAKVGEWAVQPLSVELFGSVATGSSTSASDIDLIVVSPHCAPDQEEDWDQQVDDLRDAVQQWTGNVCEILVMDPPELIHAKANDEPTLASRRVSLVGDSIDAMIPTREFARQLSEQLMTPELSDRFEQISTKMTESMGTPEMQRLQSQIAKIAEAMRHHTRRANG